MSKVSSLIFLLLSPPFLAWASDSSANESLDTSIDTICDSLWRPKNYEADDCASESDLALKERVSTKTGINLAPNPSEAPRIQGRVFFMDGRRNSVPSQRPGRTNTTPDTLGSAGGGAEVASQSRGLGGSQGSTANENNDESDDGEDKSSNDNGYLKNQNQSGQSMQAAMAQPQPMQVQHLKNGNFRYGGALYADHDEDEDLKPSSLEKSSQASRGAINSSLYSPQNKIAAAQAMDTGSGESANSPRPRGTPPTSGSGGFGEIEAPTAKGPSKATTDKSKSALSSIASALGKFANMAGFGGGSGSSSYPKNSTSYKKGKGKKSKGFRGSNKNYAHLIKDKYGRYLRKTASAPDVWGAHEHLFRLTCQHYSNYAMRNDIPTGRNHCGSLK